MQPLLNISNPSCPVHRVSPPESTTTSCLHVQCFVVGQHNNNKLNATQFQSSRGYVYCLLSLPHHHRRVKSPMSATDASLSSDPIARNVVILLHCYPTILLLCHAHPQSQLHTLPITAIPSIVHQRQINNSWEHWNAPHTSPIVQSAR